jgi:hypothetical protein
MTDLFDSCEGIDEILALVLDQAGPEGLKELLEQLVGAAGLYREHLLDAADRLEDAGLVEGANLIREVPNSLRMKLRS